jgi:hypothetical protein
VDTLIPLDDLAETGLDLVPRPGVAVTLATPLRSPLALPAAAAALVAGAAHVPVTGEHLTEVPYVGWMFVGLIAVCVTGAVLLAVRDTVFHWAVIAATCAAAVLLYLVSRGPGMPGMSDDIGDWANELGVVSVISETLVVVLACLAARRGLSGSHRVHRSLVSAILGGGVVLAAIGYGLGVALA